MQLVCVFKRLVSVWVQNYLNNDYDNQLAL